MKCSASIQIPKSKHIRSKSQEEKEYLLTIGQVPRLKPKKNNNPPSPMSLYSISFRSIQRNKYLMEKIGFLKDDETTENEIKDCYLSCPEKVELETSFTSDNADMCTTNNTRRNETPFSKNKSIKRLLKLNEIGLKEYSLECEDITPTAKDILGRCNFVDYLSPKKDSMNSPKKLISPKKSLFSSPKGSAKNVAGDNFLQLHFMTENGYDDKKSSILSLLEFKRNGSFDENE